MKKGLKIIGIILLLIIGFLAAVPYLFKDKIKQGVIDIANENLNAKMSFADMDLSLFKNFPNLSVNLENFTLDGIDDFEGVRLAEIKDVFATVDLSSLFGDSYNVSSIKLKEPRIDIRVLKDGKANYDIAKESTEEESSDSSEESSPFNIEIQEYSIEDGYLKYVDETMPLELIMNNLNHSGKGDLSADKTLLQTISSIDEVDFTYDGVQYVKRAKTDIKADLELDLVNSVYTFKENSIKMNELEIMADGFMAMPSEDIEMDITFKTVNNDFRQLLSMVPAYFASNLNGVDITGIMGIEGYVKGVYNENSMPGFGVDVNVKDGGFNYTDLPKSVRSIQIDAHADSKGGASFDDLRLDIPKFYMEIAENPIDVKLFVKDGMTDPSIDCDVRASIVLDHLKDVVPLEKGDALEGSVNADVSMHGRISAIEKGNYEDFDATGQMIIQDIMYKSDSLSFDMNIDVGYFNFSPKFLEVSQLKTTIGETDLSANGRIDNYLAYLLKDEVLSGTFNVSSDKMDVNALMAEEEDASPSSADAVEEEMAVIELPGNVDFTLNTSFGQMLYGDVDMRNVSGGIRIFENKAYLKNLKMDVLQGSIQMDGTYDSSDPNKPTVDMILDMKNIDIKESAEKFYTIEKMAPIAKSCSGRFSTKMNLKTDLSTSMEPIEESIVGGGNLSTDEVYIEKFKPLNEIAKVLGIDKLSKQTIEDVKLTYEIKDGKAIVNPFKIKAEGIETTIGGSTTLFDQEMDYKVDMLVPFEKLPKQIGGQANSLLTQINDKLGTNISVGDKIPVSFTIKGKMEKPEVKSNYGDIAKEGAKDMKEEVKELVKGEVKELIDDTKDKAKEQAQAEADKILEDARKEADKILADAKTLADKAKTDAYKEADKVEGSYANVLEKAGKKIAADAMRKTADTAHQSAMKKAQEKADSVLANAKKQSDEKINSVQ